MEAFMEGIAQEVDSPVLRVAFLYLARVPSPKRSQWRIRARPGDGETDNDDKGDRRKESEPHHAADIIAFRTIIRDLGLSALLPQGTAAAVQQRHLFDWGDWRWASNTNTAVAAAAAPMCSPSSVHSITAEIAANKRIEQLEKIIESLLKKV